MKIKRDGTDIVIRIETDEERDALISVLDRDRNHPARRDLYDRLRQYRSNDAAADAREWIDEQLAGLTEPELMRIRRTLQALGIARPTQP